MYPETHCFAKLMRVIIPLPTIWILRGSPKKRSRYVPISYASVHMKNDLIIPAELSGPGRMKKIALAPDTLQGRHQHQWSKESTATHSAVASKVRDMSEPTNSTTSIEGETLTLQVFSSKAYLSKYLSHRKMAKKPLGPVYATLGAPATVRSFTNCGSAQHNAIVCCQNCRGPRSLLGRK